MKHRYPLRLLLLVLIAWGGAASPARAVPARPRPVLVTQSDGTQIRIRIMGDERCHYVLSDDGYTLATGADGDYYFATLSDEGRLVPTSVKARPVKELTPDERRTVLQLRQGLRPTAPSLMQQRIVPAAAPANAPAAKSGLPTPPTALHKAQTTGKVKSLVILAQPSDRSFTITNPRAAFQRLLMEDGYADNGASGSAWNFYRDNSQGKFDPDFQVVGPYRVSKTSSYYAGYDGTDRVPELIVEACRAADADVDFREYADDGIIRDVFVFYPGTSQAETGKTSDIWPHRWDVRALYSSVLLDGQQLQGYACSSELSSDYYGRTRMAGIGTFCHEFGHVLGWPDFYDTDYTGSGGESSALEDYSLMCSGSYNNESRTPAGITLLERWMAGWATPRIISSPGDLELAPVSEGDGVIVLTPTDNDYFLLEYRDPTRWKWDAHIGTTNNTSARPGMLVYHIDFTPSYKSRWEENTLNASPSHECCKFVYAIPGSSSAYNPGKTLFPAGGLAASLSPQSHGSLYRSWKAEDPDVSFEKIALENGRMTMRATLPNSIFVTLSDNGGGAVQIILPEEGLSSKTPLRFGAVGTSTEWYIDGARIAPDEEVSVSRGQHTLEIATTNAEGHRMHIIKYITVK